MNTRPCNAAVVESIFRRLGREVWIITAAAEGKRGGLVATWFSPASIDRDQPLVVTALAPCHYTRQLVDASGAFAAHLIAPAQIGWAWNFCQGSGSTRDKLAEVPHTLGETGSPIITAALAWLECRVTKRLHTGDRVYYWAAPVAAGNSGDLSAPLTDRELFLAASPAQKAALLAQLEADVTALRGLNQGNWKLGP